MVKPKEKHQEIHPVILLPLPSPFLQTFLLEPPLSCSPLIWMLSISLLLNFPVSWVPCPLFSLTPSFLWFLFCSCCLWKSSVGSKKNLRPQNLFFVLRLGCSSPSEGLRPETFIFRPCFPAGLHWACCPQPCELACSPSLDNDPPLFSRCGSAKSTGREIGFWLIAAEIFNQSSHF